jgi:hypothetical protein
MFQVRYRFGEEIDFEGIWRTVRFADILKAIKLAAAFKECPSIYSDVEVCEETVSIVWPKTPIFKGKESHVV